MISIRVWILVIIGVAIPGISADASVIALPESLSNVTSGALESEPSPMLASISSLDNQITNRTDETSKPTATSQGNLSRGIVITNTSINFPCGPNTRNLANGIVITNTSISFPCEITVRFDSFTAYDVHEFYLSSNGEFDLSAFVQGNRIDLTDNSVGGGIWVGTEMPPFGLGDASYNETIYFDPGTEVTVSLPDTQPLSIFTVGQEVDECGRIDFDDPNLENLRQEILQAFKGPPLNWFEAISKYQNNVRVPWYDGSFICAVGSLNDKIGNINQVYEPPDYGAGTHEEISDAGDFALRYTITAKRAE
jgi:hypothetical protein